MGESFGAWQMGDDAHAMPLVDQANLACGFHAGDPLTIQRSVALAVRHGVSIGAHPAYPDLQGFGRRHLACSAEKVRAAVPVPLMVTGGFRSLGGMAVALGSGAMDLIGLARSLAIEPDLPQRLLAGQEPQYAVRPISTGIKAIDRMALMEVVWYSRQLRRMAKGQAPKPNESGLWSFCANLLHNGVGTWKTRRLRA